MMLGLKDHVIAKDRIYYLIFYDIDRQLEYYELEKIDKLMQIHDVSYMIYETLNGTHIIGLTPIDALTQALIFTKLQTFFPTYYSGRTIRLSRKENETQKLLRKELDYGEVIPNLLNIFATRFNYEKLPWTKETAKYLLIFEKYRTKKLTKLGQTRATEGSELLT